MTVTDETFALRSGEGAAGSSAGSERAASPAIPTVHPDAIAAIMGASHGDPFAVLGPHRVGPGHWEVRAVLPEARAASLVLGERRVPFEKRHADGFYVARVEGEGRPLYEIEVEAWDGTTSRRFDPYGFGSSIEQYDVAGLREVGTNLVYRILGPRPGASTGSTGSASPSGPRTPRRSASSATSTSGTAAATRCAFGRMGASGNCSSPAWSPAAVISTRSAARMAR